MFKLYLFSFLVPINAYHIHWVLAVINLKSKSIKLYDSLKERKKQTLHKKKILNTLHDFLVKECIDKRSSFDTSGFLLENVTNVPLQNNAIDCGIFTVLFSERLSRREETFNFRAEDMPYYRRRMVYELINCQLIDGKEELEGEKIRLLPEADEIKANSEEEEKTEADDPVTLMKGKKTNNPKLIKSSKSKGEGKDKLEAKDEQKDMLEEAEAEAKAEDKAEPKAKAEAKEKAWLKAVADDTKAKLEAEEQVRIEAKAKDEWQDEMNSLFNRLLSKLEAEVKAQTEARKKAKLTEDEKSKKKAIEAEPKLEAKKKIKIKRLKSMFYFFIVQS